MNTKSKIAAQFLSNENILYVQSELRKRGVVFESELNTDILFNRMNYFLMGNNQQISPYTTEFWKEVRLMNRNYLESIDLDPNINDTYGFLGAEMRNSEMMLPVDQKWSRTDFNSCIPCNKWIPQDEL